MMNVTQRSLLVVMLSYSLFAPAFTITCQSEGSTPEGRRLLNVNAIPTSVHIDLLGYRSFPAMDEAIRRIYPTFTDSIRRIEFIFSDGKDCRQAITEGRIGACQSPLEAAKMRFLGVNGTLLHATGTAGIEVIRVTESKVGVAGEIENTVKFSGKGALTFKLNDRWETATFELQFPSLLCTSN